MSIIQFPIVGNRFRPEPARSAFAQLVPDHPLRLEFEPDNPYDANAIKVHATLPDAEGNPVEHFVGFIPKDRNVEIGRLLRKYPGAKAAMFVTAPMAYLSWDKADAKDLDSGSDSGSESEPESGA